MNCKYCNSPIEYAGTGRIADFCSNAHRQAHYRLRKNDYQRQRQSAALKALISLNSGEQNRNVNLQFLQPSGGAGVFHQVYWTI